MSRLRTRERIYTLPEVAREAGVEYRTLHSWVQRGLVRPLKAANGTGYPAALSERDVAVCGLLARLRAAGCGFPVLEAAVRACGPREKKVTLYLNGGVVITAPVAVPDTKRVAA
jgi:DNA-binding transcriptional MerR regulator